MPDDPDDEGVLDPSELDIDGEDGVRSLGDGRYVVEPGDDTDASSQAGHAPEPDAAVPLSDGAFALTARARAEARTDALTHGGDDVAETFEALVRWYAALVAPEESPETAVATLLRHSSLSLDVSSEQ